MAYHPKVSIQNDDDSFYPNDIDNCPALARVGVANMVLFGTWECIWVRESVTPAECVQGTMSLSNGKLKAVFCPLMVSALLKQYLRLVCHRVPFWYQFYFLCIYCLTHPKLNPYCRSTALPHPFVACSWLSTSACGTHAINTIIVIQCLHALDKAWLHGFRVSRMIISPLF